MHSDSRHFQQAMSLFPTGVTVVTLRDEGGESYGLTVSSFTYVSVEPQLVLICLNNEISGLQAFQPQKEFAVSILSEEQCDVSTYFATSGTDRTDLSGYYVAAGKGPPIVKGALVSMECVIVATYPGGDHTIVLGQVQSVVLAPDAGNKGALLYFRGSYGRVS